MMTATTSRKLEETFCGVLRLAFPEMDVRASHEDASTDLPRIVVTARVIEQLAEIRVNDDHAEDCELRVEFLTNAFADDASRFLEYAAERARDAIERATVTGWRLLVLRYESLTRESADNVRSIAQTWRVAALT